ncbi:MAG: hypothetical protein ACYC1D_04240 [Acidimicrobiales bacterium]
MATALRPVVRARTGAGTRAEPPTRRRATAPPAPRRAWAWVVLGIGVPLAVGVIHVLVVWGRYHVGSFDDDASYVLTARALASGHGLTSVLPSGAVLAGIYPPGYGALLAPLAWLWPHSVAPMRLLSLVSYLALFPLTWWYLGRRRVGPAARTAVLALLALNPVLATYGAMIMAEAPYLVGLLVLLLAVDLWDRMAPRRWQSRAVGLVVVLLAGAEVWLKEAGLGAALGLAAWQLWRRRKGRALAVVAGTGALLLPVLFARLATGIPIAGARYAQELSSFYHGGLVTRVLYEVPQSLWQMISTALPATIVPFLTPLHLSHHWPDLWKILAWHVTILVAIGAVRWWRRHRDCASMLVGVYLLETLAWPDMNERRIILVLPVVIAWYVLGAQAVWEAAAAWAARRREHKHRILAAPQSRVALAAAAIGVVMASLAVQFPRDYLFPLGVSSSQPRGSRYMAILAHLGTPTDVVETDYQFTSALYDGHRSAAGAFIADLKSCSLRATEAALAADHASFLLLGALNKPGVMDNACILHQAQVQPWAVRLLRTRRDEASVFELIGPGTGHPDLQDNVADAAVTGSGPLTMIDQRAIHWRDVRNAARTTPAVGGQGVFEWNWGSPRPVTQVSVGEAAAVAGATGVVKAQLLEPGRGWVTVASHAGGVGDQAGAGPYLLAAMAPTQASALRVIVSGNGFVGVQDVHALGPITASATPPGFAPAGLTSGGSIPTGPITAALR